MNRIDLISTMVLLTASCCFAQHSPNRAGEQHSSTTPEFSITVTSPEESVKLTSAINFTVTVTNTTDHEIYWAHERSKDGPYTAFRFVLTKSGHEVETTFFHRVITGRQRPDDPLEVYSGSSILLPYKPGKMFAMTLDLKRLYEVKEPGLYTLDVSRFDEASKMTVSSKKITLKITP